ncbi:unnamed protein product [Cuscuta epithymum]|uniref:ATP-dependent DNA helicase n=1 Tax=Cuscuta epithymum TaxID=186058 RepID=A0AAV0EG99_9ASTE|nr:unnamed protein product [Cuscuta epithymum]
MRLNGSLYYKSNVLLLPMYINFNRHCFEALDRSMRDILSCSHDGNPKLPFGGKTIVFGGDFRQVLPVIPKGTRQDIVLASLNASHLWQYCTVLKLTKNMRLKNFTNETANPSILKLLPIGYYKLVMVFWERALMEKQKLIYRKIFMFQ